MKIGILECGAPPDALAPRFGDYPGMMRRMLGRAAVSYAVKDGELPPEVTACDAYVLTGSSAGVYDDLPWIPGLMDFLRRARGRAKLVGVCFGHQAMAEAFGGVVEKSAKGWGIGLQPYRVVDGAPWLDAGGEVVIAASHQDQVVACPPGARVVAESAFTPYAALDYGDAISFQFHPEFDPEYGMALIETRRERYGALAEPALASYAAGEARRADRARVAGWIGRFLDTNPADGPLAPLMKAGSS